ncbi:MAG: S41 family peptidase [Clostridia bacterium]|nr:S41 family peptidase [Clostridia bacterium]
MNDIDYAETDQEEELEKYKKRFVIKHWMVTILLLVVVACFSSEITQIYGLIIDKKSADSDAMKNINVISENLKNFRKVIDAYYLGDIDEKKMLDQTLKGYVKGLGDEYTEYMTTEEWQEFDEKAFGNFVGIGVVMSIDENENIVIISVVENSPAEEAGIKEGDVLAEADGTNLLGGTAELASSIIKGHEGTKVHLKIIRDNDIIEMDVDRRAIELYQTKTEIYDKDIGYILFQTFDEGSAEEFRGAYEKLKAQGAKRFIVDLRNNTGGVVDEAENIADLFLDKGKPLIITKTKDGKKQTSYTKDDMIIKEPVVVLVNNYSASASEMLAGTLKDYGRAKIVGTKTFGKGVMQSILELDDGSALKITVAEYFTASEATINKVGITPDVEIKYERPPEDNPKKDNQLEKAIEVIKDQK